MDTPIGNDVPAISSLSSSGRRGSNSAAGTPPLAPSTRRRSPPSKASNDDEASLVLFASSSAEYPSAVMSGSATHIPAANGSTGGCSGGGGGSGSGSAAVATRRQIYAVCTPPFLSHPSAGAAATLTAATTTTVTPSAAAASPPNSCTTGIVSLLQFSPPLSTSYDGFAAAGGASADFVGVPPLKSASSGTPSGGDNGYFDDPRRVSHSSGIANSSVASIYGDPRLYDDELFRNSTSTPQQYQSHNSSHNGRGVNQHSTPSSRDRQFISQFHSFESVDGLMSQSTSSRKSAAGRAANNANASGGGGGGGDEVLSNSMMYHQRLLLLGAVSSLETSDRGGAVEQRATPSGSLPFSVPPTPQGDQAGSSIARVLMLTSAATAAGSRVHARHPSAASRASGDSSGSSGEASGNVTLPPPPSSGNFTANRVVFHALEFERTDYERSIVEHFERRWSADDGVNAGDDDDDDDVRECWFNAGAVFLQTASTLLPQEATK